MPQCQSEIQGLLLLWSLSNFKIVSALQWTAIEVSLSRLLYVRLVGIAQILVSYQTPRRPFAHRLDYLAHFARGVGDTRSTARRLHCRNLRQNARKRKQTQKRNAIIILFCINIFLGSQIPSTALFSFQWRHCIDSSNQVKIQLRVIFHRRPIFPARLANQNTGFVSSCPHHWAVIRQRGKT